MSRVHRCLILVAALLASVLGPMSGRAFAATFTVTTTADTGAGSLRQAIIDANGAPGSTIDFALGPGTHTISTFGLPFIETSMTIDGSTVAGQVIEISGGGTGGVALNVQPNSTDTVTIRGLTINGFNTGIFVLRGTSHILGVNVGTSPDGMTAIPNEYGIHIEWGDAHIGGAEAGRNVISGNTTTGIVLRSRDSEVVNSYIGLAADGLTPLGNGGHGIHLNAGYTNTIGSTNPALRNVISANQTGIRLDEWTHGNTIINNYIGTDHTGTVARGNEVGISMEDTQSNRIGDARRGNLISGNGAGIGAKSSSYNLILGNFIGIDPTGSTSLANQSAGITLIMSDDNHIGWTSPADGNVISGNFGCGIQLFGSSNNNISNNVIGLDATGAVPVPNDCGGVLVGGSSTRNRIGGVPNDGNIISGNNGPGIELLASGNSVGKNVIGLNRLGAPAGNRGVGIKIAGSDNVIGGRIAGNVVSSNEDYGIDITGANTRVFGNMVGTDPTGTIARGNSLAGIASSASDTTIGAPNRGNLISGNSTGIELTFATRAVVQGNKIGTNAIGSLPIPNSARGVAVNGGDATIGGSGFGEGNLVAHNAGQGIYVGNGAKAHITSNSIFANDALGIDLEVIGVTPNDPGDLDTGGNSLQNFPVITSIIGFGLKGILDSTPSASFEIEFFGSDECDPSGNGEGAKPLHSTTVTTDAAGIATIDVMLPSLPAFVTATATGPEGTSEFSECFAPDAADVSVSKRSLSDQLYAGAPAAFEVVVTNNGPRTATNVVLTDRLPNGMRSVTTPRGCANRRTEIVCRLGSMRSGESRTFRIEVVPTFWGVVAKRATVTSEPFDPNPANNQATVTMRVLPSNVRGGRPWLPWGRSGLGRPSSAIERTAFSRDARLTQQTTVAMTVANAADALVSLTIPAGFRLVGASGASGCTQADAVATCRVSTVDQTGKARVVWTMAAVARGKFAATMTAGSSVARAVIVVR